MYSKVTEIKENFFLSKIKDFSLVKVEPKVFTPKASNKYSRVCFYFDALIDSVVDVEIYDFNGNKVRELKGIKNGDGWDGKDETGAIMKSGLYLYKINVDGKTAGKGTVKLVR